MSYARKYRVHFQGDNGPETVTCYGTVERDGDRVRIGDCLFREKVIIWLVPAEDNAGTQPDE